MNFLTFIYNKELQSIRACIFVCFSWFTINECLLHIIIFLIALLHVVHHEEDSNEKAERFTFIPASVIMSPNSPSFFCMYRKWNITIDTLNNVSDIPMPLPLAASLVERHTMGRSTGCFQFRFRFRFQRGNGKWRRRTSNFTSITWTCRPGHIGFFFDAWVRSEVAENSTVVQ